MLSAIVLTKNEEGYIENCLRSLSFCDEIIVIDDFSSDNTIKIARNYTQKIFKRRLKNDFSAQRNYGLKKSEEEWILFIDANEVVSSKLRQEISEVIRTNIFNGLLIPRKDIFLGKRIQFGEIANLQLLRLAKRGKGVWLRPVHEEWKIQGKIGFLRNPIIHYSHENLKDFLKKINYYSTINANYLHKQKVRILPIDIFLYPSTKFLLNFILKKGFLDGLEGFLLASFMSLHSFLTRAKLYLLRNDNYSKKNQYL